jgi:6-pyruvoyltetrahydropterin/6-carboxytetrahydropterin synthase
MVDYQPTSETWLLISQRIIGRLPADIKLFSLKLQETDSSFEWYATDNL